MLQQYGEAFCGKNDAALKILDIPDGVVRLGTCAFARCPNLKTVKFPATLAEIGQGAFRECSTLDDVKFSEGGVSRITLGTHAFAQTPLSATIMTLIEAENFKRAAMKIRMVYNRASRTGFFLGYRKDYAKACAAYDLISDWGSVSEGELRHLIWDREHAVSTVRMGGMSEQCFRMINREGLRDVCNEIVHAGGDIVSVVEQQRTRFYSLLEAAGEQRHLHEVYNRIVCAICRERKFVQVIDVNRLHTVESFLADSQLRLLPFSQDRFSAEDWSKMSHAVYGVLKKALPDADPYEIGVFSWCLADVLRDEKMHNDDAVYVAMREEVEAGLHEVQYA